MQQRQFTSGSRQAPDPFDQFLEENNYYRKHTARDASCLFRVISEQMYDTQLHHFTIRAKCVTYMRKHRKFFEDLVDRDFDEYLDDMSKPKTYGTLLELQAAGYLFERNVFLFEPFNLGNYFNDYRSYFKDVFRVFYTPERHFDSVFTSEYIEEAAICQSICYEILYKDLFKLPDVSFAVEQMLHGIGFDNTEYHTETNQEGYATHLHLSDGRSFELDMPNNTSCILENYKLCHFHYPNFPSFSDDLQRELKTTQNDDKEKIMSLIQRTAESFLPNKYISCVRQLLQEGITPFPYKVAKALDPNMYRNIEFDSWNEVRKELKFQNWYNGDTNFKLIRYHTRVAKILQVGAKCHVKLRKSEQDLYTCHIQEIAVDKGQCIVFIEQLGEKRVVPYENLTPLPPDQFKPWTVPYRFQRQMQKFSSVRLTRQYNYKFKFNATTEHHHQMHHQFCGSGLDSVSCSTGDYINEDDDPKRQQQLYNQKCAEASFYKLKHYTHLENFGTHTVEFCAMPLTVEHNGGNEFCDSKNSGEQQQCSSGDVNDSCGMSSRSSNAVAVHNNAVDKRESSTVIGAPVGQDYFCTPIVGYGMPEGDYGFENYNTRPTIFVPELQSFCHMYAYPTPGGMPEECYGYYGYDGSIAAPTYMSALNGYYYFCPNGPAPPGSFFSASGNPYLPVQPGNPLQVPQPNVAVYANGPQYAPLEPAVSCASASISSVNTQNTEQNSPSPRPSRRVVGENNNISETPLSGRINYEAKKSFKTNGSDLPTDTATLRFFYNLGLDFYHTKQSIEPSCEEKAGPKLADTSKDVTEKLATDLQDIKLDENGNQIAAPEKSERNNNVTLPDAATGTSATNVVKRTANNRNPSSSNASSVDGYKTNQRRFNSHFFSSKYRQVHHPHQQHRNHHRHSISNPNSAYNGPPQHHQHNQQHQSTCNQNNNDTSFKNNFGADNYQTSMTPSSGRNMPPQQKSSSSQQQHRQHQHHNPQNQQQYLTPNHAAMMAEQGVQTSPMCGGYDDPIVGNGGNENQKIPTTNNHSNNFSHGAFGGTVSEHKNDELYGGQMMVPFAGAPPGVYVPMPMAAAPGPVLPPYNLYASHPTPHGYHSNSGNPSFVNGPLHMPPPSLLQGVAASSADFAENKGNNSDMLPCNNIVGVAPRMQGTHYAPPPMPPYYVATGGTLPPNITGNGSGPNGNAGLHLMPQIVPPTPTNHHMPQSFPTPQNSSMGSQGYFCLPPQHGQMPPPQPQIHQPSPMTNSIGGGNPLPAGIIGLPIDSLSTPNNNCVRSDIPVKND